MKKRKSILVLILVLIIFIKAYPQNIKVIDKADLQPIKDVTVFNKYKIVKTDKNGNADISAFILTDTMHFRHISYQMKSIIKSEIASQNNTIFLTKDLVKLEEVVLSANKKEEKKSDVPNKIQVISSKEIDFKNPQSSGDLLQQSGKVFVQQSQLGGSSPVIRGFEANKVLMVIDGVRMNNAVYRSGHLQNVITIDPNVLEKVEVVFGPGSVIYGSDALGGVMHFITKNPELSSDNKLNFKAGIMSRYSSANEEVTESINLNFGLKKWGFLTNISNKNLGDLREGNIHNPAYGSWGKCLYYAERINGKDSMIENKNPNLQINTGYKQYDLMQKVLFKPNDKSSYLLNLQFSNSSDIPRYDRLSEIEKYDGKLKYAEWYYGPQQRFLASFKADFNRSEGLYDNATVLFAYQNISEDRMQRNFDKPKEGKTSVTYYAREYREETVDVGSLNIDLYKTYNQKNELRYGVEGIINLVGSKAYSKNLTTGENNSNISSRYPDKGSSMNTFAGYITHNWEIGKNLIFSQGIRMNYIALNAEYTDTMMKTMKFPFDKKITQKNSSLNGSLGLVYKTENDLRFTLLGTTGFRAPNVDDITKVNDSKAGKYLLVVPNPDLKPENAYNAELSVGKTFNKTVQIEGTVFYTLLKDAIVMRPFKFNGQDSVMYSGTKCAVQANSNTRTAYIYGFQANLLAQLTTSFSINSSLSYTVGRDKNNDEPLDHIPPVFGRTGFNLQIKKLGAEFYVIYNGWKWLKNYSSSGEDNLTYATVYGNPAWYTLNLKAAYQLNKYFNIGLGLENILDEHYRYFASGISAPGRNFIASIRAKI